MHCIITEARDPTTLMPKLKCVILEEVLLLRIVLEDLYPSYKDLVSCYGPLADVFESRGVELLLRMQARMRVVDVPVRDLFFKWRVAFRPHLVVLNLFLRCTFRLGLNIGIFNITDTMGRGVP